MVGLKLGATLGIGDGSDGCDIGSKTGVAEGVAVGYLVGCIDGITVEGAEASVAMIMLQ